MVWCQPLGLGPCHPAAPQVWRHSGTQHRDEERGAWPSSWHQLPQLVVACACLYVILLEHGAGPDKLQKSRPTPTVLQSRNGFHLRTSLIDLFSLLAIHQSRIRHKQT